MTADSIIHLRVPASLKARWVRESRAAGMRLTDWICARVDGEKEKVMKYTEYTIVATDRSVDARAAADACNRELMAAGDSGNRDAAEVRAEDAAGQPYSHTPGRA